MNLSALLDSVAILSALGVIATIIYSLVKERKRFKKKLQEKETLCYIDPLYWRIIIYCLSTIIILLFVVIGIAIISMGNNMITGENYRTYGNHAVDVIITCLHQFFGAMFVSIGFVCEVIGITGVIYYFDKAFICPDIKELKDNKDKDMKENTDDDEYMEI